MSLHADVDIQQLYKNGEELCGDNVIVTRSPENTTIVISDGLGSGVKANILATMTTKIASSMLKRNIKLDEVEYVKEGSVYFLRIIIDKDGH